MSCPACFTGTVRHNEKPAGHEAKVYGRDTYVADPLQGTAARGTIVIIPDAFGSTFINNRILADNYARKGDFKVYLPDFMDDKRVGTAAPLWMLSTMEELLKTDSWWAWITKPYNLVWTLYGFIPFTIQNSQGTTMPKVRSFLSAVRAENPALPVGTAGFCWGGQFAVLLAHGAEVDGKPLIDASFTAHPSFLKIPGDIEKIKKPVSIAIGDKDFVLSAAQAKQTEGILKKLEGVKTEIQHYAGAGHGFAVRADYNNDKQSAQAAEAEDQAVNFFTQCFKEV